MDLFSKIDWRHLKSIITDIELILNNYHEEDAKDKIELTKLFYEIERELALVKKPLNLPNLNSYIDTDSVIKSFKSTPINKDIFDKDNFTYDDFHRQNDYQYWLLIFLLLKNNNIRENKLTLYEIIEEFVGRVKNTSFTWRDIELTGSGATRCRTNIRFAYDDLKKAGLVNLYDRQHKNSWTLTYLGFFIAASFCLNPVDKNKSPFSKTITRFYQSTFYFRMNKFIWERIDKLTQPAYFNSLVKYLNLENLGLKELIKGPEIFNDYNAFVFLLQKKYETNSKREKALGVYLKEINAKYSLDEYMKELSLKFNAEAFFDSLIKAANKD